MVEHRKVYEIRDGVIRTKHWDDDYPDRVIIQTTQDVEPILDSIERDRAIMAHDGVNKLAARIPVAVYERAVLEDWEERDWKKWLNSSEGRAFRIWQGRV